MDDPAPGFWRGRAAQFTSAPENPENPQSSSEPWNPEPEACRHAIHPARYDVGCIHAGKEAWNPKPYTLNPKPYTLNPKPYTLNPKPYTLNPKP